MMKIVFGVLLITVASALDHHDTYSWKRREDCKIAAASRLMVPVKVKETRLRRSDVYRSRSSNPREGNAAHQNSPRRFAVAEDSDEHYDLWKPEAVRTRQDLTRENRAIESTLKNAVGKPSKAEQYHFSNFPYVGDVSTDSILEDADHPKSSVFPKDTQDHFLSHNTEEMDWSGQEVVFGKDEEKEEINIQEVLNEMRRKRLNGVLEEMVDGHRQGRGRKLTSQQQGALLVETLRKKRNHTGDHRGHSNLQNGLMDMLGRSM